MIKREQYLKKIRKLINKDIIKVITGIRRSGKSYLLKSIKNELIKQNIKEENILLISFESIAYNQVDTDQKLNEIVYNLTKDLEGKIYLLFDEIQNVNNWEKSINGYRIDYDCDIYITGSNSQLLSGELSTLLSGRYIKIEVYPFSYKEILQYYKENYVSVSEKKVFDEYITYGGMPFTLKLEEEEKIDYLNDLYIHIIKRYNSTK